MKLVFWLAVAFGLTAGVWFAPVPAWAQTRGTRFNCSPGRTCLVGTLISDAIYGVSGDFSGDVNVGGHADAGALSVTGQSNLKGVVHNSTGDVSIGDNIAISGYAYVGGIVDAGSIYSPGTISSSSTMTGGTIYSTTGYFGSWVNGNKAHLFGNTPNGASAIGVVLYNAQTLSTAGAKLISIQNNSTETSFVDLNGEYNGNVDAVGSLLVSQVATPTNQTHTLGAGTLVTGTYYYRVSATVSGGETLASTETSLAITGPAGVNAKWNQVVGATGYKVYGRSTGAELLMATVGGNLGTWLDDGSVTPSGALPTANTTGLAGLIGDLNVAGVIDAGHVVAAGRVAIGGLDTYLYRTGNNVLFRGVTSAYQFGSETGPLTATSSVAESSGAQPLTLQGGTSLGSSATGIGVISKCRQSWTADGGIIHAFQNNTTTVTYVDINGNVVGNSATVPLRLQSNMSDATASTTVAPVVIQSNVAHAAGDLVLGIHFSDDTFLSGITNQGIFRHAGIATASLPACAAGTAGSLGYDSTTTTYKWCNGSAWTEILGMAGNRPVTFGGQTGEAMGDDIDIANYEIVRSGTLQRLNYTCIANGTGAGNLTIAVWNNAGSTLTGASTTIDCDVCAGTSVTVSPTGSYTFDPDLRLRLHVSGCTVRPGGTAVVQMIE